MIGLLIAFGLGIFTGAYFWNAKFKTKIDKYIDKIKDKNKGDKK